MPTEIQPVPDAVLASEFPSLADRAANTYNTKAKAWADSENAMVTRAREIALTAQNNATVATEQAVIATNKAGEASDSAQAAANSADAAAQSATNAQGFATAAAGSVTEAEELLERYQGALAADPTLNKDGGALVAGDWYVNSVTGFIRAFNGTAWVQGLSVVAGVSSLNGEAGDLALKTLGGQSLIGAEDIPLPAGILADYQEFTTSGTWTKPAGATWVYVEAIAGGGGGGNNTSTVAAGASGGEFVSRLLRASDLAGSESVAVGAGGLGGASGGVNPGSDGGASSFGAFLTAKGGYGGEAAARITAIPRANVRFLTSSSGAAIPALTFPQAGYGGSSGPADGGNTINGGAGGGGSGTTSALGGESEFGGNGGDGNASPGVKAGNGVAPGGGGGASTSDGGGGDGAPGVVRVWCW